jgi:putative glycerol-1-phosphate prenyltransferase
MLVLEALYTARASNRKLLAVLVDPDGFVDRAEWLDIFGALMRSAGIDFVFVGGSLLTGNHFEKAVHAVKCKTDIPVVLFPGSPSQISNKADAVLFLSLISGRNPDLLIGQHVHAAASLKQTNLEVMPTGYMLVDCGRPTTASYISHTLPLPWDKPGIAAMTALAGEYLGLRLMYLDGGSGAARPVSEEMIAAVRNAVSCPLIVGGGIRTPEQARAAWDAGADMVVVGTLWEKDPGALIDFKSADRISE